MITTPSLGFWRNPVTHAVIAFIVMIAPFILTSFPAISNLTISAVVLGVIKYLQNKSLIATGAVKA